MQVHKLDLGVLQVDLEPGLGPLKDLVRRRPQVAGVDDEPGPAVPFGHGLDGAPKDALAAAPRVAVGVEEAHTDVILTPAQEKTLNEEDPERSNGRCWTDLAFLV